jgi:pimeloyl-ACP methyl ester carboxylesterase
MNGSSRFHTVQTAHGSLAVEEAGTGRTPILFIHGNSSCRAVFRRQLQSQLSDTHRLITFDLPGHGQSSDAPDPIRSYTLPGLADAVTELLTKLGISEVVVMGWSLGGHIGVEMLSRVPGMKGLIITGTPPIRPGAFADGFVLSPHFQLASRAVLDEADVDVFARAMFDEPVETFLRQAIFRTDARFREQLFAAGKNGAGIDQRLAVESNPVPLAVVNGSADRLVNLDYLETIAYRNLWNDKCHRLEGAGHAPFWHAPAPYNSILEHFLLDLD